MSRLPGLLQELVELLSALPGIGPKSAERIALYLVEHDRPTGHALAKKLEEVLNKVQFCKLCGAFTEIQPCKICTDPSRRQDQICVVERPLDVLLLERSGSYKGVYHVLGGRVSPIEGVEPQDLRIESLLQRIRMQNVKEVILALSTGVEGDATAFYLAELLQPLNITVSRLGAGLPFGTDLGYADELTISQALKARRPLYPPKGEAKGQTDETS